MTETTEIDLTKFCGISSVYDIASPFVLNGWEYATDMRIAVRVPAPRRRNTIGGKRPPVETLFNGRPSNRAAYRLDALPSTIGNLGIRLVHVAILVSLPNLQVEEPSPSKLHFVFEGGEGCVTFM